jgi:hypothetical protein
MMKLPRSLCRLSLVTALMAACSSPATRTNGGTGGAEEEEGGKGGSTSTGGSSATGGKAGSTGGSTGSTGGSVGSTGGSSGSTGGSSGSTGGAGGSPGTGGAPGTGGMGGAGPVEGDVAGQLHGAYLELTCMSRITAQFCQAKDGEADQKIPLKFGGEAGKMYDVVMKVWGIVEMQTYKTGMPLGEHMQSGADETMVGNANYSVYGLLVGETLYALNRYPSAGGDKTVAMHYTSPPIKIPGGATLTLRHFDKNNHATRNFSKLSVPEPTPGLLAKIKMQPFDGSFLYIEVVSAKPSM